MNALVYRRIVGGNYTLLQFRSLGALQIYQAAHATKGVAGFVDRVAAGYMEKSLLPIASSLVV